MRQVRIRRTAKRRPTEEEPAEPMSGCAGSAHVEDVLERIDAALGA